MRPSLLIGFLLFSLFGGAIGNAATPEGVEKFKVMAGQWQVRSFFVPGALMPMPPFPKTSNVCLKTSDISVLSLPLRVTPGCEAVDEEVAGKEAVFGFKCSNSNVLPDQPRSGKLVSGMTSFSGNAKIRAGQDQTGQEVVFEYRFEGQRLGDCPP
jgi:hypothetical protein